MPLTDNPSQTQLIAELRRLGTILDRPLKHGRLDMADLIKALEVKGDLSGIATALSDNLPGMAVGNTAATFTAATFTPGAVITHGLGRVPRSVVSVADNVRIGVAVSARTASSVTLTAFTTDNVAVSGTVFMFWAVFT